MQRIDADILIPGRGDPIADGSVVTDAGTITYAGPRSGAPAMPALHVPVAMPGLWDCHGHFFGTTTFDMHELMHTPVPVAAVRASKAVETALGAGFTSVREAGGLGVHMARLVEEGILVGPSIYAPGAILSQTGGHGDLHAFPVSWVTDMCERAGFSWLCDGVPECLKAVRSQLRLGAKVIKICASGGVMSEVDHPVHQQFSGEELRAIVEEAGRAERVVMAHCHGKPGIMAALEAGVHTIEHGSYLDEEAAVAMRETGSVLVPTRLIVEQGLLAKDRMPDYAYRKLAAIADSHMQAIGIAHQAGVSIALGTDIFSSNPAMGLHWGMNGREFGHLVNAGLTPIEAIESGTANGPSTLGPQAPRSGQLAKGYDADIIAVASSPLEDISVLADPANVTHVWKAGALVKSPVADAQG
jgi:imidazolonepropionase-like amidohydrolase